MGNSAVNRLRAEALSLSYTDRSTLVRDLISSLDDTQSAISESDYRIRMRKYVDNAWLVAANTLSVSPSRRTSPKSKSYT